MNVIRADVKNEVEYTLPHFIESQIRFELT